MGQGGSTKYLAYMWRVRMKEEGSIKREGGNERSDRKIVRKSIVTT